MRLNPSITSLRTYLRPGPLPERAPQRYLLTAGLCAVALAGCGGGDSPDTTAQPPTVTPTATSGPTGPTGPLTAELLARDDRLRPARITVAAAIGSITILNKDDHRHVFGGRGFDVRQEAGARTIVALLAPREPGTYTLVCRIHPRMQARVRVTS